MPEPKPQKYDLILQHLIYSIRMRDGEDKLLELRTELKGLIKEGTHREAIVQMLARDKFHRRIKFLILYPELIVPYFIRIKRIKS